MALPHVGRLPLLGGQMGVHVLQLLGGDEADLPVQTGLDLGEGTAQSVAGVAHRPHNGAHRVLEEVHVPVGLGDDLLPVPLVHVDGVDVVQALVPADGVHVRIQAVAGIEAVALEGQALPLGQRVDHLSVGTLHGGNVEAHGPLHAVEVVVEAGVPIHEQRRGHPAEVQGKFQVLLEAAFHKFDGPLHVVAVERGAVAVGNDAGIHGIVLLKWEN